MKKLYEYDPETGEFRSESSATPNPKKPGGFLGRVNATFVPVPEARENEVAVWNGEKWEIKPDYRGTTYYIQGDDDQIESVTIKDIGETVPDDGYLEIEDVPTPPPTPEELQKQYLSAVDTRMTAIANTRGYDSIESAAKYIGNTRNGTWAAEGEALRDWAIDVYEACYAILGRVMAGEMPMPSIDGLLGMLPYMVWPDGEIVSIKEGDAQA